MTFRMTPVDGCDGVISTLRKRSYVTVHVCARQQFTRRRGNADSLGFGTIGGPLEPAGALTDLSLEGRSYRSGGLCDVCRPNPPGAPDVTNPDLREVLAAWPYEPGRINARRIVGSDGRTCLQVRLDLGLMQMELEGRPDGRRPEGFASLLEYQRDRLRRYADQSRPDADQFDSADNGGNPAPRAGKGQGAGLGPGPGAGAGAGSGSVSGGEHNGFVLSPDECRALREEAIQYYHRYVCLFALGDFTRVVRDTTRNLAVLDLLRDYAATQQDRQLFEMLRPQILTMRIRAEAETALAAGRPRDALAAIDRGLGELRSVFEDAGGPDEFSQANEVQLLMGMRDALVPKLPASQRAELQERLQAALDAENYELAAILRDELRLLGE